MNIRTYSCHFSAKENTEPYSLACLVKWIKVYPLTSKPCWAFVYSALLVALFSCEAFEEMIAGLTWPCKLPPGWSVVCDESSAGADSDTQEWCLVRALSRCLIIASCRLLLPLNNELCWTVVVKNFCNPISLSELFCNNLNSTEYSECMKYVLMYSLELIFVWVIACEILIFSGFNREFTRGTTEFYASWIGVALQRWLAHWVESFRGFCHIETRLFSEKMLRPHFVVVVVKRLNILATCREIL
jgi:hypothetical protein